MRILMLVATSVANDARVLKEARTLAGAGHAVHIIGKSVPADYVPEPGITVSSVGASSVLRREGSASLSARTLPAPLRLARWALLPWHRNSAFARWAAGAAEQAAGLDIDVVHAHDFTALAVGSRLARERGVPLVYDTHEFWTGRARQYRPTPLQDRRERREERRLGAGAAEIITVGAGVADALRRLHGWPEITVVHNSFERSPHHLADHDANACGDGDPRPHGLMYAGRLGDHRDLETVVAASALVDLPVTLMGPADETWLRRLDPGRATLAPACAPQDVDAHLAEAGLVLVTLQPGWENHRLALPNKLFHAVSVGAPVVASDLGELARTVREHNLGTLYTPGDPESLADAVRRAVADYPALLADVAAATAQLSWERDGATLLGVYARLARRSQEPG